MSVISDPQVQAAFDAFPPDALEMALQLRALIFETAAQMPQVGLLQETLKWGQPSYLPKQPKTGTTLRLGIPKSGGCAIYAHCATNVISSYAQAFPNTDQIEGNRAVIFDSSTDINPARLTLMIRHALTYHL
ncbi:DUF1801 domain-containing protein [Loktanella sp. S4079]|uniref:DUF1801 domain-containing protein n=1 Tax=Loktanella sp. S4079 TaxID=579483 RepID=UPI0005F9DAFA|nr:DUF1801 domain-containing protein [Loktanella sp. S4079]KJZ20628.1 hypothetical protein TW80_07605 [Loktanella sp. S4079]